MYPGTCAICIKYGRPGIILPGDLIDTREKKDTPGRYAHAKCVFQELAYSIKAAEAGPPWTEK